MFTQSHLTIHTPGRKIINLTQEICQLIKTSHIHMGICHLFLKHTSASLILCENADPLVQQDLETFMLHLIPNGGAQFQHITEGLDDMPAHIRTVLTSSFLTVPITNNHLALGKWQGIYLWEHRLQPHQRNLTVTIYGIDK